MPDYKTFEHRSVLATSAERLVAFHADPGALARLAMPPTFIRVVRDDRVSLTEGEIEFNLWLGPLPVRWVARHEPGPIQTAFTDRMLRGPMAHWEHQHIFQPLEDGAMLIDRITLGHKAGWRGLFTRLLFDGLPLRILFIYRHWRTRRALM
jgi:ligand-binding SRPBCC domain-containing protein